MKKNSSVQGTFSRLFGKKHGNSGNSSTTSLYVTNPPWVFTQEVSSEKPKSSGDIDGIFYGDNRFGSVTDCGTATLKARPRVRPLLTFLPLNAQEGHGVAVPTPSVPEGFEEKTSLGLGSQINGGYRKYNSVLDLRSKAFDQDYFNEEDIPPPPSVPPPPPPSSNEIPSPPPPSMEAPPPPPSMEAPPPPPSMEAPPPPPSMEAPPPPPSVEVPPPPPMAPPPPPPTKPVMSASTLAPYSYPYSNVSSPSTPSPPDFIPPPPPLAFMDDVSSVPPPPPPLPFQTPTFSNGVSKWKSETVLNLRQSETSQHNLNLTSPPTPNQKDSQLPQSSPDPNLTFPRSLKVPPPTPVRTSSIPSGEKESSPQEEQLPKMVPHSRPALPPSFTIQVATMVHSTGEDEEKTVLEKPCTLITNNSKLISDSNGSSISSRKSDVLVAEETKFSTSDSASSDDDDWKERTNLDKLKHELSALLSSSCRKDDRQSERTVVPKTKTRITDGNQGSTDELKPVKPAVTGPQLPVGIETERKEKTCPNVLSPSKAFTGDALSAADSKSTTTPTNSVIKFKNELEAVLSPTKEGGPPLALANLRHNPETKKQVTLQFGGSLSRLPKLPANQNPTMSEMTKKVPESPNASSGKLLSGNADKLPTSPLKQKNEAVAPAAPSPLSSGTASPVRTASPNIDFSLLQYKTHRTRFGSVDSMGSGTSSQTADDGPISTNNSDSQRDSAESMSSQTPILSRNTEQANNNHILIHPVTGEQVERGSPLALLLAAQQRAQKDRCSSASTSRQNSYLSEKPLLKLSEKLQNSSQSETGSSSSTIYFNDSKPNTVTVVPKSPQKASPGVLESKQPNGAGISEGNFLGTLGLGQRERRPYSYSSASEQCRNVQQLRESEARNPPTPSRSGTSVFEKVLTESSHLNQQDPHTTPEASLPSLTVPQSHTQSSNDVMDVMDYEIIPPPPEFSNDASGVTDGFSNRQENLKCLNLQKDDQISDKRSTYNHPSYSYGNNYSLTSNLALDSSLKPSGYSHHYTGGTYTSNYLSSYPNSRPLIKKRLYMTESDRSYGRSTTMSSRSMSTPTTYGHNTMAYNSQVAEGMRRMNAGHRNVSNSAQGRRVSLELPGKMGNYNTIGDSKYKGQNGEYHTNTASTTRPTHGSQQYGGTANTFTVRPGTRQPISYSHQGGLR